MSTPADGAGREAGGFRLHEDWLRAASGAAPGWYAGAVLALGAFAAVALVGVPAGAGLAGLGVALCGLGAARVRSTFELVLWVLAAALAAMPALRAAVWVWLPCLIAAVTLASLAAADARSGRSVAAGLLAAFWRLPSGVFAVSAPLGRLAGRADGARVRPALRGVLLAALLLGVFVPLFTAADAAFAELVDRALPSDVAVDSPVARFFALATVAGLGGALALVRLAGPARAAAPGRARLARTEWLLPLGALVTLFAAFVAVQLAVLFGGHDHVLRTAKLSYADYAHQGYGQLMAAAMLTLAVIAGARRWARVVGRRDDALLRILLVALCALCLVVLASALKRLGLYEEAYGSTRLRMLADANILWLGAVLLLVIATLASGRAGWLPRALVLVSACGAVAFAASNPDGRIASANVDHYFDDGHMDEGYLSGLSADAVGSLTRLPAPQCVLGRIRAGLERPDGILGANLSRARARDAVEDLPASEAGCVYG